MVGRAIDNAVEERRELLVKRLLQGWSRAAAEYPTINWEASSLDIDLAEHAFEQKAHEFIHEQHGVTMADLKGLFQARTQAYIEAS